MSGVNNTIGTDSDGTNDLTEGNVISGNLGDGIRLADGLFAGTNHVIAGNFIGVDFTGNAALGNAGAGVRIVGSSGTVIGGGAVDERNVIADNAEAGIAFEQSATGNTVSGNYIGVAANGVTQFGNLSGICLLYTSPSPRD